MTWWIFKDVDGAAALKPALRFSSVFCEQQEANQLASYLATSSPTGLMLRTCWRWFHHCLQMVELLCAGRVYYCCCHRVGSTNKTNATTLLFQSISYILLRLHNLYKYIEFLNASNYVFPTNHLVVWCCRDECGGGGDSREENIDRSFHPKSRLRITFFSFCFITFFFTWPKRQDYRFTRARHASFLLSQERKKKKKPEGGTARRSRMWFCYGLTSAGKRRASLERNQTGGKNSILYIYLYT